MNNKYERLRTYPPGQVLKYVSLNPEDKPKTIKFEGKPVFMGSKRYLNFKAHGLSCVSCGLRGIYFALEKHKYQKTDKYHFNLYGIDQETGEEVMLTKDHIKPRSKGGTDDLDNFQVMCARCNASKGNNWLSQEQLIHQAKLEEFLIIYNSVTELYLRLVKKHQFLKENCPHDVVINSSGEAFCSICGEVFGWFCSKSPTKICQYIKNKDICDYCGQPRERK